MYFVAQLFIFGIGFLVLVAVGFWVYHLLEQKRNDGNPIIEAPFIRTRSMVHHPDYGAVEMIKYDPDSRTHGQYTGVADGRTYTWTGHDEEFHMRSVPNCIVGQTPEYDYVPMYRAQEINDRHAGRADETQKTMQYKKKAQEAIVEGKMARTNIDMEVDKHTERMNSSKRSEQQSNVKRN